MSQIIGLDLSHWQGSQIDWSQMAAAGVRFVYLKCSQGTGHKDKRFEANYVNAKSVGLGVGAYHFATTDKALDQYNWFVQCMGERDYDLVPALDCEYYTSASQRILNRACAAGFFPNDPEIEIILDYRMSQVPLRAQLGAVIRGRAITTEAIVDGISNRLKSWIEARPKLAPFKLPTIYTNLSSGNAIFKRTRGEPLWIANWHGATVRLTQPNLPKAWKGQLWYIWQDEVVDGAQYGISGAQVDHDIWGPLHEFPGETPPPVNEIQISAVVTYDGVEYKLVQEKA